MLGKSPIITAAICTLDRHELLREAVDGILVQTLDRSLFRILIVDNSTDRASADSFYRSVSFDPVVSVIWSDPPGLSRARNRAAAACGTRYIAYIDDDARPDPGWLSGLLDGFAHSPKVAAVGGPIVPIWGKGRPGWLPQKHLSMFTILESIGDDRDLPKLHYIYGANMAFAVERLLALGGFPEQIGRKGNGSLLSCEETQVQDALRDAGYVVRFATSASVRHLVHEDRLRPNWMRSRMIWQVASEQLQNPPLFQKDWVLDEIKRLADHDPDVSAAARLFFEKAEGEALDFQLDAIHHFSALLMGAHLMPESTVETCAPSSVQPVPPKDVGNSYAPPTDRYAPSAAGASYTQFLFVEGLPGHAYLYDLFGDLDGAQLLTYPGDQAWGCDDASKCGFRSSLEYIDRSIGRRAKAIFFLTFDSPLYGPSCDEFLRFLGACPVPVFGILHRMPDSPHQIAAVRRLDNLAAGICFLSETMVDHARSTLGLQKACYLPHHPTTFAFPSALRARQKIRARMGVQPGQITFAVIGEARRGKGIALLLSAFERIPASARERMFFVFAGKARDHSNEEVRGALAGSGTTGFADLRHHPIASHYAVLSGREYAEYVAASDIGLLLYQDEQRHCMSGVLGDFVWANCNVIATADSYVGAEVRQHNLGLTLQAEEPSTLAAILTESLRFSSMSLSPTARRYRARISPDAVLQRLRQLMDQSDDVLGITKPSRGSPTDLWEYEADRVH